MQTIRRGSRGNDVAIAQTTLNNLGYNAGRVDGIFGAGTEAAVKQFQAAHGLLADGIVGPKSWAVMMGGRAQVSTAEPVYYSQVDQRWRAVPFTAVGNHRQTIGSSGCGPTCMAMILATWVNRAITPVECCRWAVEGGFRTPNDGTAWAYFTWMANHRYGLKHQLGNTDQAVAAMQDGALVVASMDRGYFTNSGHFILPYRVEGNMIICHDPANKNRDRASVEVFRRECRQYFIFRR